MKKITTWQAADGTIFTSAAQCNAYEQSRNLKDYNTREDWLKEIYARLTVHLYKHYLTKLNSGWSILLRCRQDYGYKIAHWRKILDNNKDTWDYTQIPANKPLEEFIYNRYLYQSNQTEVAQIYLPERLLTLDLSESSSDILKQIKQNVSNIKDFYKVKVEYKRVHHAHCYIEKPLFLFTLTDKCRLVYKVERSNLVYKPWDLRAYSNNRQLPLIEKRNRLIIEIPCI